MKGSGDLAIVDLHWLFAWGFGLTKQVTPEAAAEPRFGCFGDHGWSRTWRFKHVSWHGVYIEGRDKVSQ
jgi:hypothetical protein